MKTTLRKTIYTLLIATTMSGFAVANTSNKPIEPEKKNVKISGKVIDYKTGEALTGVKVYFFNSNQFVYTDFDGEFTIEEKVVENTDLYAAFISYEKASVKIDISKSVTLELKRQQ